MASTPASTITPDWFVSFHINPGTLLQFLETRAEGGPRLKCFEGSVTLVSPGRSHESKGQRLDRLLLGASPDHARVRRRPLPEEVALALLRFEERHLAPRQRSREGNPRRAAARADVHERPAEAIDERNGPERVLPEHLPRAVEVAQRRQAGRRDNGFEPGVSREGRRRSDSAPSPPTRSRHRRRLSGAGG